MRNRFYTFSLKNIIKFIIFVGGTLALGGLSALITGGSNEIYQELNKPMLAPPGWIFPIVWSVLYVLMGFAAYLVSVNGFNREDVKKALLYYVISLIINILWPVFFFNLQMFGFAFFWCAFLAVTIAVVISKFKPINRLAGYLLVPYLLWVLFAAYLNLGVWILN